MMALWRCHSTERNKCFAVMPGATAAKAPRADDNVIDHVKAVAGGI
jgi:hypothetical protein